MECNECHDLIVAEPPLQVVVEGAISLVFCHWYCLLQYAAAMMLRIDGLITLNNGKSARVAR